MITTMAAVIASQRKGNRLRVSLVIADLATTSDLRHPCQCSDLFLRADAAKRLGASRGNVAKLPTLLE